MIPMLRVFSSVTLRAMTSVFVRLFPGRKKALAGPRAACVACPDAFYVVEDSIDVSDRLPPHG